MNENIDLTKILKNCPKETKLYSTVLGYVTFEEINNNNKVYPIVVSCKDGVIGNFTTDGKIIKDNDGECTLFSSKDQRDWSKFTAPWYKEEEKLVKPKFKVGDRVRRKGTNKDNVYEITKVYDESYGIAGLSLVIYMKYQDQYELVHNKFDPKTLKPFDKILVREHNNCIWKCNLFSYIIGKEECYPYRCVGGIYKYCIPYNNDTKHLVGTTDEAPEYYRYWED